MSFSQSPDRLPSLNALRAFEVAGRHLSFTRAARELHVTQGAVSRLVKQLEEDLGVALLRRGPRGLELTPAGAGYLPALSDAFQRLMAATQLVSRPARQPNHLAIAMLPTFAMRWFMPRLADFHRQHPEITVDVTSVDRPIDFQAEPIDVGIQYGSGDWTGLAVEFLMAETVILVASPALLKAKPIRQPDEVRRHVLLTHSTRPEAWAEWFAAAGLKPGKLPRGPAFEHFFMSIEAAVNGLGLALVPDILVQAELADGRLIEPLPRCRVARKGGYYLLCLPGREREPAIQAFRDWLLG